MKTPKSLLLLLCISLQTALSAQVQWYQSQNGNNPPPYGTYGSCAKSFTPNSFVACYQWSANNEEYTWKVSKSHINGNEQKTFFITGTWASVEMRTGENNSLYVLLRNFPMGQDAEFTIYKLDTNLVVRGQKRISFPNNFSIFNINAFELDESDNVYVAGDGQYLDGGNLNPASFLVKTDRSLRVRWSRVDSSETSFSRLHIDPTGKVVVIEDSYSFFPEVRIKKYSANGSIVSAKSIMMDPARFNLLSKMDDAGNLYLYGGKMSGDTAQSMYLMKMDRNRGNVVYNKTYYSCLGLQLCDLKIDRNGGIFNLVSQYMSNGEIQSTISRINTNNGNMSWNQNYPFATDSSMLVKLVVDGTDRFYAIGERRSQSFFAKGYVMRMRKNGLQEGTYNGPDSINAQRSFTLVDGFTDRNDQLISIGNTNDFDPYTYSSTYFKAFATKFGQDQHHHNCDDKGVAIADVAKATAEADGEEVLSATKLSIFPNPVQDLVTVTQEKPDEFDRITVYNMEGAVIMQQSMKGTAARMDVSSFSNGVYLMVLRSSQTMKEKNLKFVVRK
jgi:Secretion system C-terminal sorting domain